MKSAYTEETCVPKNYMYIYIEMNEREKEIEKAEWKESKVEKKHIYKMHTYLIYNPKRLKRDRLKWIIHRVLHVKQTERWYIWHNIHDCAYIHSRYMCSMELRQHISFSLYTHKYLHLKPYMFCCCCWCCFLCFFLLFFLFFMLLNFWFVQIYSLYGKYSPNKIFTVYRMNEWEAQKKTTYNV